MSFIEKIRKGEIIQPTKPKFDVTAWEDKWNQTAKKDAKNESVYHAGKTIYLLLEEIRSELKALHEKKPEIDNEKLIMAYFAMSNRDRAILSKNPEMIITDTTNVFSASMNNNRFSSELTIEEIVHGCIDGIEKAVLSHVQKRASQSEQIKFNNPLPVLEFISKEMNLSQMYGVYENYWHALLWGEYTFYEINKEEKIFGISQDMTPFEIGDIASQIRKSRLYAQSQLIITHRNMHKAFTYDKYILKKVINDKTLKVEDLTSADEIAQTLNSSWRFEEACLPDEFPMEAINHDQGIGFSILEALNVLRLLMLLSVQLTHEYPADDEYQDVKKLLSFCPKIKRIELIKAIAKVTGHSFEKASKIMNFFEFDGSKNKDLWCHPIIAVHPSSYIFLTSALITPVVKRIVEHWIVVLGIELDGKGSVFEHLALSELNEALGSNKLIDDYDRAVTKRLKIQNDEEEIDLLCRIGNTILVGEAKSVVTTDSPISCYRTLKTLEGAAEQAERKTEFVKNNLEEISKKLSWTYDSKVSYSFVNCVINSNRTYVGNTIKGVPICDEKILIRYFESSTTPLLTNKKMKHVAWIELYNSFESLQKNLATYLFNPPQISISPDYYEYKESPLPTITKDSFKILYKRIVPKDFQPTEYLNRVYKFPVRTVENIDDELREIDKCI